MSLLDDFREQASASFEEEELEAAKKAEQLRKPQRPRRPLLGITPVQRFVIALLLLLVTLMPSCLCLVATQRVVPPGLF